MTKLQRKRSWWPVNTKHMLQDGEVRLEHLDHIRALEVVTKSCVVAAHADS